MTNQVLALSGRRTDRPHSEFLEWQLTTVSGVLTRAATSGGSIAVLVSGGQPGRVQS
jgi:hypothetical protein